MERGRMIYVSVAIGRREREREGGRERETVTERSKICGRDRRRVNNNV